MAYPNPNYYQPYPQQYQMPQPMYQPNMSMQMQPNQQVQPQPAPQAQQTMPKMETVNGGFVSVRSEQEARNYPVAPMNSITFKDETAPYVYTKTMGLSQLEPPRFEKYRLVKEEDTPVASLQAHTDTKQEEVDNSLAKELNGQIKAIKDDIDDLWKEIDSIKEPPKKTSSRKREEVDE